jgi:thiosulfate/3-mercaptopyruvate sulfurtransferase
MRVTLRPSLRVPALCLFLMASVTTLPAAGPRDELVVNVAWLNQHIKDPNLVLLHVGDPAEYKEKHLPGARFVQLMDISAPMDHSGADTKTLSLELPSATDLHNKLAGLGISDNSTIVVYYGNDWYSPSTRVIFTLNWAGLGSRTKLLDGGMRAWTAAGHVTTAEVPAAKAGTLSTLKTVDSVVEAPFVQAKKAVSGVAIVDGREKMFYDGVQTGGQRGKPPVLGHIPGALSIPFVDVFDDNTGLLQPADKLAELFKQAGVKPGDEVVAYCHIGQQATAVVFAARTLGFKARLYDGSMDNWIQLGLPVQKEK